jgi:hypothetical protein
MITKGAQPAPAVAASAKASCEAAWWTDGNYAAPAVWSDTPSETAAAAALFSPSAASMCNLANRDVSAALDLMDPFMGMSVDHTAVDLPPRMTWPLPEPVHHAASGVNAMTTSARPAVPVVIKTEDVPSLPSVRAPIIPRGDLVQETLMAELEAFLTPPADKIRQLHGSTLGSLVTEPRSAVDAYEAFPAVPVYASASACDVLSHEAVIMQWPAPSAELRELVPATSSQQAFHDAMDAPTPPSANLEGRFPPMRNAIASAIAPSPLLGKRRASITSEDTRSPAPKRTRGEYF